MRRVVYRRAGLEPFRYVSSREGDRTPDRYGVKRLLIKDGFVVPNLSGGYQAILIKWWERHGLGSRCLLVSETNDVKLCFSEAYPRTSFTCTDYYMELRREAGYDVLWDLSLLPPPELPAGSFDSVYTEALAGPDGSRPALRRPAHPGRDQLPEYVYARLPLPRVP